MSETTNSRRWAGRAMIGAAALALPLTASITYAESLKDDIANAPEAPAAPAAPSAPSAPDAQEPPAPPAEGEEITREVIVTVDPDTGEEKRKVIVKKVGDGENVFVMRSGEPVEWTEIDEIKGKDGKTKKVKKIAIRRKGEKMSEEEMEKLMAEMRAELAEADVDIKNAMKMVEKSVIEMDIEDGEKGRTVVKMECRGDKGDVATVDESEGEIRKVYICQSSVMAQALKGLKAARAAIAENPELKGEMRSNMLEELDRQIEEWQKENS